jgi:hypothetical protein
MRELGHICKGIIDYIYWEIVVYVRTMLLWSYKSISVFVFSYNVFGDRSNP